LIIHHLGRGSIGDKDILIIHDVLFVEGLKHNLLSISQLCDKGYQVIFKTNSCEICLPNSKEVMLIGKIINNVYLLDISSPCSIGFLLVLLVVFFLSMMSLGYGIEELLTST